MVTQHWVESTRAELGLYHVPRLDVDHSTEWLLNTGLSLHRGLGPSGPILLREGLSMLLKKINKLGGELSPTHCCHLAHTWGEKC